MIAEYEKIKDDLAADRIQRCIAENARIVQNQEEYEKRYKNLVEQYEKEKTDLEVVTEEITAKTARSQRLGQFIADIKKVDHLRNGAMKAGAG